MTNDNKQIKELDTALGAAEDAIARDIDKLVDALRYYAAYPHLDHTARLREAATMLTRLKVYVKAGAK